jgi:ribonuclease VapC
MIVDTSAVIAVLNKEEDWREFDAALRAAPTAQMCAATYVELGIVVDRLSDPSISRRLDRLLEAWGVEVVPLTATQARTARAACRDFGRGSGHPARLNLGDCFAYALAADSGQPLLFKGDDFSKTDIDPAVGSRT